MHRGQSSNSSSLTVKEVGVSWVPSSPWPCWPRPRGRGWWWRLGSSSLDWKQMIVMVKAAGIVKTWPKLCFWFLFCIICNRASSFDIAVLSHFQLKWVLETVTLQVVKIWAALLQSWKTYSPNPFSMIMFPLLVQAIQPHQPHQLCQLWMKPSLNPTCS